MNIPLFLWLSLCVLEILLCGIDKYKAVHHTYRIPEAILLLLGLFGGAMGLSLGMILFHHKVSKPAFRYGVPAILLLHLAVFLAAIQFHGIPALIVSY